MVIRIGRAGKAPANTFNAAPLPSDYQHGHCRPIRVVCTHSGQVLHHTKPLSAADAIQHGLMNLHHLHPPHGHLPAPTARSPCASNYLLCESTSLRIGKRPCPLHPDKQLEFGRLYFLLPIKAFQHRSAWSHISSLAAMAKAEGGDVGDGKRGRGGSGNRLPRSPKAKFHLYLLLRSRTILSLLDLRGRWSRVGVDVDAQMGSAAGAASGAGRDNHYSSLHVEAPQLNFTPRAQIIRLNNICHNPEINSKYVEQLIDRSNSWRPRLLTIQESMCS